MACKCYHAERNYLGKIGVCWGTKECEACSCGGDESKCDFYDYVRERASLSQKQTRADQIRAMTDEELAAYIGHASLCVTIQDEDGGAWCSQYGSCNECVRDWLRQEAHDEP